MKLFSNQQQISLLSKNLSVLLQWQIVACAIAVSISTVLYNILMPAISLTGLMYLSLNYEKIKWQLGANSWLLLLGFWLTLTLLWHPSSHYGWHMWLKYRSLYWLPLICIIIRALDIDVTTIFAALLLGVFFNVIASWINFLWLSPQVMIRTLDSSEFPIASFPIYFGYSLILSCSYCAVSAFYQKSAKNRWLLVMLALFFLMTDFFLNYNRTSQVIAIAIAAYFLIRIVHMRQRIYLLALISIFLSATLIGSPTFDRRWQMAAQDVQNYQQGDFNSSLGLRFYFWKTSWRLISDKPWLGHGLSSLPQQTLNNNPMLPLQYRTVKDPHQQYLFLWYQGGILALALFLLWLTTTWNNAKKLSTHQCHLVRVAIIAFAVGCLDSSWLCGFQEIGFLAIYLAACQHYLEKT